MVVTRSRRSPTSSYPIGRNRRETRKTTSKETQASLEKSPPLKRKTTTSLEKSLPLKKAQVQLIDKQLGYSLLDPLALDGELLGVWREFLDTDKQVEVCDEFRIRGSGEKVGEDIDPDDQIVASLAHFAIFTFNKSYKLHVDPNTDAAMALTKCVECYYYKLTDNYYFYLKLKATEKGEPGVYDVVVRCECADGSRTLTKFCLDPKIIDKRLNELFPPESDTDEDVPTTESDTDEDVPINREFYEASGMVPRKWFLGQWFKGHNFYNPLSKDRCTRFGGAKPDKMM